MKQIKKILRSIFKDRISFLMNISSLIISFLGVIILVFYVSFEKSFDKFNENYQSVYRIETQNGGSSIPLKIGELAKKNIPEIENLSSVFFSKENVSTPALNTDNISFSSNILYTDNDLFEVFTLPLLLGDKTNLLNDPHSAVLPEAITQKLFGQTNPIGKTILVNNKEFKVSGVMKDFPLNSSFRSDCLLSSLSLLDEEGRFNNWNNWSANSFVKIRDNIQPEQIAVKIGQVPEIHKGLMESLGESKIEKDFISLLPLSKIHFEKRDNYSYANPITLNVLIGLVIVLTIMGAINFINFSTSQSPVRAKIMAINQVLGRSRLSTKMQIYAESVVLSIIAFLISIVIYFLISTQLENLFEIKGIALGNRYLFLFYFLIFFVLFGIIVAVLLSNYFTSTPITLAIKGVYKLNNKKYNYRNVLLTIQFVFAVVLISSAFIIEKQLNFWNNYDIGFEKEGIVYFQTSAEHLNHSQTFAEEIMKNKNITGYTYSGAIPGDVRMGWGREVDGQRINLKCWPVGANFMDFFEFEITQGRLFGKTKANENNYILNESAVSEFGWKKPLERHFQGWDSEGHVIGIVKDFNFSSLKEEVEPMMFWYTSNKQFSSRFLLLKVKPDNFSETINYIKNKANTFDPKNQIEIKFLDNSLNELYEKEEKTARFIEFVGLWCVLLSVTGLLGLVIFVCKNKIKEIGIRKVNGAHISELLIMLNKEFLKLVIIAICIASPITWYAMQKWLENFAYKTELSWWIFALAGFIALFIALATVSWQSWRAARRNPVEALRYE